MWVVLSHISFRHWLHVSCTLTNPFPWLAACEFYSHTFAFMVACMRVVLLQIHFRDWLHAIRTLTHPFPWLTGLSCTLTDPLLWLAAWELHSHKSTSVFGYMWVVLSQIRFWLASCDWYSHKSPALIGCVGGFLFDRLVGSLSNSVLENDIFNSARRFQLIWRRLHTAQKTGSLLCIIELIGSHTPT